MEILGSPASFCLPLPTPNPNLNSLTFVETQSTPLWGVTPLRYSALPKQPAKKGLASSNLQSLSGSTQISPLPLSHLKADIVLRARAPENRGPPKRTAPEAPPMCEWTRLLWGTNCSRSLRNLCRARSGSLSLLRWK